MSSNDYSMLLRVAENDFLDPDFLDEELDDSFFLSMGSRFDQDKLIHVCDKPFTIGDQTSGVFHCFDYESGTISAGNREVDEFKYDIVHDFSVTDCVLTWYSSYLGGSDAIFPYVEIAQPVIPENGVFNLKSYQVQASLMGAGCVLANPTWGEKANCASFGNMVAHVPMDALEGQLDPNTTDVLFFSYRDYKHEFKGGTAKVIGMQFNPTHPMSIHRIVSYTAVHRKIRGKYRYGTKILDFEYDFTDTRYRLHSDVWISILGTPVGCGECYDFVANFDFVAHLGMESSNYRDKVVEMNKYQNPQDVNLVEPLFIEPYLTIGQPQGVYSAIGPWDAGIHFGPGHHFRVPYITRLMTYKKEDDLPERYLEVSDLCLFKDGRRTNKETFVCKKICEKCALDVNLGRSQCHSCSVIGYDYRYVGDGSEYFVKRFRKKNGEGVSTYRVFKKSSIGQFLFVLFPGIIMSYPNNGSVSLVYPFKFLTFTQAKLLSDKGILHDYLPLSVYGDTNSFLAVDFVKEKISDEFMKDIIDSMDKEFQLVLSYAKLASVFQVLVDDIDSTVNVERKGDHIILSGPLMSIQGLRRTYQDYVV